LAGGREVATDMASGGQAAASVAATRVYLHDEMPMIGSGWRVLTVIKIGRPV
jgi:hypothetical protein